mgnify:CR=1 FL=1
MKKGDILICIDDQNIISGKNPLLTKKQKYMEQSPVLNLDYMVFIYMKLVI